MGVFLQAAAITGCSAEETRPVVKTMADFMRKLGYPYAFGEA